MAKPVPKAKSSGPKMPLETVCEPGRHVNCLHTKMAEKRAAAKSSR
jgi:hypothetical protein